MLPKEKTTFLRQISALQDGGIRTPRHARTAVLAVLYLWQSKQFPALKQDTTYGQKKYLADPLIQKLATWIGEQDFLEAAFWLSSAYAVFVGKEKQSQLAMYFTPPLLANRLIDNLIATGASLVEHKWKDPACGGGAFLTPLAIRMSDELKKAKKSPKEIVETISRNLAGNDIDPVLAVLSSNFIKMALHEEIKQSGTSPVLDISVTDSLQANGFISDAAEVIICNPPYRKMKKIELTPYSGQFDSIILGQPNIYGLFMEQCVRMAGNGSLIGLLTPTSYLSGQNFSRLRKSLLTSTKAHQLDLIGDKEGIFLGVEQEAVLSVFKKESSNTLDDTAVFAMSKLEFKKIGVCSLPIDGSAWPVPRKDGDALILDNAGRSPYRLHDYGYTIKTGAYVDYRDPRETYTRRPNNRRTKAIFPIIWSSDISTEGGFIHGRTSKQDKHPTYIEMTDPQHRSVVRRPSLALQRVTSADQERRLVGAEVETCLFEEFGGIVGENHVLFLEWTSNDCTISPSLLGTILKSRSVDRLFRSISGAVNVSIYELEQLPLPCPKTLGELLESENCSVDEIVDRAYIKTSVIRKNIVCAPIETSASQRIHTELHAADHEITQLFAS